MKNQERQVKLDKEKWIKGEEIKSDPSGSMKYCSKCEYNKENVCTISQDERVQNSICAKAYNRMTKNK